MRDCGLGPEVVGPVLSFDFLPNDRASNSLSTGSTARNGRFSKIGVFRVPWV
jgi:hypothetical protein